MVPEIQQSGVFVLVIFVAVLAERAWQWLRRRAARHWPVAEGRVQSAAWRQPRTGTNRYFIADLSYSYAVNGQFYAGYYRRSFSDPGSAAGWADRMRDRTVQVRYKPGKAAHSILREQDLCDSPVPAAELVPGA